MVFVKKHFSEITKDRYFVECLVANATDDPTFLEGLLNTLYFLDCYEVFIDNEYCGFYTLEDLGETVEIHFFINKPCRKYSMRIMQELKATIPKPIETYVSTDYPHIIRVLKMMGGKVIGEIEGGTKHGIPFTRLHIRS